MLKLTATPHPNKITPKAVTVWLTSLPPHDEKLNPVLTTLLLAFGISENLNGIEQAMINFLPYAPFIKGNISEQEKKEIQILLLEALIGKTYKKSQITNPVIKFHLRNNETPLYPILVARLHIGLVGRYHQVRLEDNYEDYLNNVLTPLNIVLTNLTSDHVTNLYNPDTTEKEVATILRRVSRRSKGEIIHYLPGTVRGYTNSFVDTLFNSFPYKPFKKGGGGSKKKLAKAKPRDSFMPDRLPLNHPTREIYGQIAWNQLIAEIKEADPEKAKHLKKRSSNSQRGLSQSYLDPYRTPANTDRLSLHTLALIEQIIQSPQFIQNPFNRLTFKIVYHIMLHLRRPIDFSANLQLGVSLSALMDGPILDIEAGVIYKIPLFYFGKPSTLVNEFGLECFLQSKEAMTTWDSEFEGYEHSAPISAIPLPRLILDEIIEYRQLLPELPNQLLCWQDELNHLLPIDADWFNEKLRILTKLLQTHKTDHQRITQTLIKNSFDAYYIGRLNCVDYWHISERAKYVFEMPARYTGLSTRELAERYYSVHNSVLDQIEQVGGISLGLPRTDPKTVGKIPEIRLGSWHALELGVITNLATFFRSSDAKQLVPTHLNRSQKLHNLLVYEIIFLLGCLNGLRDFEASRLEISDYSPENQSLVIRGRGGRMRELPLHPMLSERIERLLRTRRKPDTTQLLWLYGKTGRQVRLTTSKVNAFFAEACLIIGWDALDFYGLRHRFRSELVRLGIPDTIINYLMGHGKDYVSNFNQNSLDDVVLQAYLSASAALIEKFGLR